MAISEDEKTKLLLQYAEEFPINDLPGYTSIMTLDSTYTQLSDNFSPLIGYKSKEQAYGKSYENIPCKASENSEIFKHEDQIALEHEIKLLSYHYFDDWRILIGHKKPIIKNGETIGTLANFIDVTACNVVNLGRFLWEENQAMHKKQFSFIIQSKSIIHGLTLKEQECLFYLLRGLTFKEIALVLQISITTVQTHIENVKIKLNVKSKSQLIERAIFLGFMCFVPKSLFK